MTALDLLFNKIYLYKGLPRIKRFEEEDIGLIHRRAKRVGREIEERELDEDLIADMLSVEISWVMKSNSI